MKKQKIVIVGNGQIGSAIFRLLGEDQKIQNKKYLIEIYDKDKTKNKSGKILKECLANSDFVFLCLPSWHLDKLLKEIALYTKQETILISLSKGIDAISKKSVDQLIEKNAPHTKYALLSGPMFAKEIMAGKMSFGVLATKNKNTFETVNELFQGTKLKLEYSKKIHSVAISAVLKNVYTLAVSIIDSSLEDNNTKGFFSAKGIREMREIMKILGLDQKIILSTAGLGDFIATVSSEHSQNRKVGTEISKTGNTSLLSEGLISLPSLIKIIGKKYKKLPMLCMLERIVVEKKDAKTEINKFLSEI
jgi:glycerol-3-phosphate dehydrogenase (NAD(P)+)